AQNAERLNMVALLVKDYGYKLSYQDFFPLSQFRSVHDLQESLTELKRIFGVIPPVNTAGLIAIRSAAALMPADKDMLQRLFLGGPLPSTAEALQQWIAIARGWRQNLAGLQMSPEAF